MSDERSKGSYLYPNTSDDPDRIDVLRNKFGIQSNSELSTEEYRATAFRMAEIAEGDGPGGNFDKEHLKAIHGYIFQDVYEWAGHTRNEIPIVDGARVEPIGGLAKGGTSFLHGSRIEFGLDEALKPIRDPEVLRGSTPEQKNLPCARARCWPSSITCIRFEKATDALRKRSSRNWAAITVMTSISPSSASRG
ncbi:putative cell filamentation protein (plasmid) [Rhizobium favelukesii]|uniref:protein adenylyltransferase n=1 Tax=Rhizobium favelukesii TaxID=348824 RepID=W6RNB3_9HYPH|nr:putative cell filamentation protein [Rhizobium favelukesii]